MAPKKTKSERSFVKSSTLNKVNTVAMVIQACKLKPKNIFVTLIHFLAAHEYIGRLVVAETLVLCRQQVVVEH